MVLGRDGRHDRELRSSHDDTLQDVATERHEVFIGRVGRVEVNLERLSGGME